MVELVEADVALEAFDDEAHVAGPDELADDGRDVRSHGRVGDEFGIHLTAAAGETNAPESTEGRVAATVT
ncbi:hypothetical protein [Halolamina salifodinae]|uniref:Uncharacterized protein n=1 Tax=Halolamina salifodinae TaxID=1202767 RepID=A0A8T4GX93_9EURY|nr:hypothetical protein [Halolamina salifodinae]MBP1986752.1 hypothetical protein [Halolamina salifodinae]